MKVFTFLSLTLLAAAPMAAQPVRDIIDAPEAVRAHARDMQPVLEQLREMGAIVGLFANVQKELSDGLQPGLAINKALEDVEEYMTAASRRGANVDRENRVAIESLRRLLEESRNAPNLAGNTNDLREKVHHNFVHPLQRRALQMNRHAETLMRGYENLAAGIRAIQSASMSGMERLAIDPEKP